jgi:AraC-like DNA-binding protein
MPLSAIATFSDPDDYAASFHTARAELSVTVRGSFRAEITLIDLGRLRVSRFYESLQRVGHWANLEARAVITFATQPGPTLLFGGVEMQPTSITRHNVYESGFLRSSGPASWASMSLSVEEMAVAGATIIGSDLTPPTSHRVHTPLSSAMIRLQQLHADAGQLAIDSPEIITNPGAARGLEQTLTEALVDCFGNGEVREDRSARQRHAAILQQFRRVIEGSAGEPVYMPELCAAIGISTRTLRVICQEHLGTSPKRYLLLRRMFLARKALRETTRDVTTVTEIATRYGFWELGRFAVAYRSLFSETPSATLKRSRGPVTRLLPYGNSEAANFTKNAMD